MKIIVSFFEWLERVGLGVWVGGMLTLGALVAPVVFNTVKPIEMAGDTMSLVFHKFNSGLVYVCILLVVVGFVGKWLLGRQRGKRLWVEGGLLIAMVLCGLYIGAILGPKMQALRQITLTDRSNGMAVAEFDHRHRESVTLFSINILLGLAVIWVHSGSSGDSNRRKDS